ncbi:hypothetical protein [uncultured Rossellomorea sp.]|nr:hypothetical protein [uncultured Rossellomorea sp.]
MVNTVQLELIKPSDRSLGLPYLLLADERKKIVEQYTNAGDMYSICYGIYVAGVVLFTFHSAEPC